MLTWLEKKTKCTSDFFLAICFFFWQRYAIALNRLIWVTCTASQVFTYVHCSNDESRCCCTSTQKHTPREGKNVSFSVHMLYIQCAANGSMLFGWFLLHYRHIFNLIFRITIFFISLIAKRYGVLCMRLVWASILKKSSNNKPTNKWTKWNEQQINMRSRLMAFSLTIVC